MKHIHHLIDGRSVEATSGRTSPVFDPATGAQTGLLGLASEADVDAAVAAAARAFEEWRGYSVARRTKLMYAFRNLVEANQQEIAARLSAEHGKVVGDAEGEVARGLENIEYACGIAEMLKGAYNENASSGVDVYTVRQPLGGRGRDHPVQLPGHGSAVDDSECDRRREHLRPQALGT